MAHGGGEHLRRQVHEVGVDGAHENLRPFHQPRHLTQQGVIMPQSELFPRREILRRTQDGLAAARRIEHDRGPFKLFLIVGEIRDGDGA